MTRRCTAGPLGIVFLNKHSSHVKMTSARSMTMTTRTRTMTVMPTMTMTVMPTMMVMPIDMVTQ